MKGFYIITAEDELEVAKNALTIFTILAKKYIIQDDKFIVALSGGNSPKKLYQLLSAENDPASIDWSKIHLFWGDERAVPLDDPLSNFKMVKEELLDHIDIPTSNIHYMDGGAVPEDAADRYNDILKKIFASEPVRFDLVLLGLGEDGHTASLFPGVELITPDRYVSAVDAAHLGQYRITLTSKTINLAKNVMFLATGGHKAKIVSQVVLENNTINPLPAQNIQPSSGNLFWLLDNAAASLIPPEKYSSLENINL